MIFSWHSIVKIMGGVKTQTRRLYKDGHIFYDRHETLISKAVPSEGAFIEVQNFMQITPAFVMQLDTNAVIYREGQVLAVQDRRGGKGMWYHPKIKHVVQEDDRRDQLIANDYEPLKIKITGIKPSVAWDISQEDIEREGFKNFKQFARVWAEMHDRRTYNLWDFENNDGEVLRQVIRERAKMKKWTTWALDFEVVKA